MKEGGGDEEEWRVDDGRRIRFGEEVGGNKEGSKRLVFRVKQPGESFEGMRIPMKDGEYA
jgi:hypothetical protein